MIIMVMGMPSREERYYDKNVDPQKRSIRNQTLYKTIYEDETYSNIEGIMDTTKTNEIDISKVREMLKLEQEGSKRSQLIKKDLELPDMATLDDEDDDKNYDIRDILAHAKEENDDEDKKRRSLKNIDFEALKEELRNKNRFSDEESIKDLNEIKNLINTITGSNDDLNSMGTGNSSLDIFSDLKGDTTRLNRNNTGSIEKIIAEAKKYEEENSNKDTNSSEIPSIDKSFYTTTLKLKKKDFMENDDEEDEDSNTTFRVIVIILFIIIAIVFTIVGYSLLK